MKDGHADAFMAPAPHPYAPVLEIASVRKPRFLPISKDVIDRLVQKYGYVPTVIPKGTYDFLKEDYPSFGEPAILVIRKDLPNDLVYVITKALVAGSPEVAKAVQGMKFVKEGAPRFLGGPLHPGAEMYYKQAGLLS